MYVNNSFMYVHNYNIYVTNSFIDVHNSIIYVTNLISDVNNDKEVDCFCLAVGIVR
jgi:hypothetical protein